MLELPATTIGNLEFRLCLASLFDDASEEKKIEILDCIERGTEKNCNLEVFQDRNFANLAYRIAKHVLRCRWPEAESFIMEDPGMAYAYANHVLQCRWPEAEPFIMKDPQAAWFYVSRVRKLAWPEAEPYIMQLPMEAALYARYFKGIWPEAESTIIKDPQWAADYAMHTMHKRWPEAEEMIFKSPNDVASIYAREFNLMIRGVATAHNTSRSTHGFGISR